MTYRDDVQQWVAAAVALGCLPVAVLHLARSLAMRGAHRLGELSSASTGFATAAMSSPPGGPVP